MKDLFAPANAFDWRRFSTEESARRGEKPNALDAGTTSRKRSVASTQAIERIRESQPGYGTIGMSKKTAEMISLKPKTFSIYSKSQTKSKGRGFI
jgi:hypothetical protein